MLNDKILLSGSGLVGDAHGRQTRAAFQEGTMQITEHPHLGGPSTLWAPDQHLMTYAEADGVERPQRGVACAVSLTAR